MRYTADADVRALAGREQLIRYGGAGAPLIAEVAVCQVQAEMGLATWAAQRLAADAVRLLCRLPQVLGVIKRGEVDERRARMAAAATRGLTLEQVATVDARLASPGRGQAPLLARLSRRRLDEVIDQVVDAEDPEQGEDEVADALNNRDVSIRPGSRGTSDISGSLSSADGTRLEQRLAQVVGWLIELGDDRPQKVLRSVALGMLADPGTLDELWARVRAHRTGQHNDSDDGSTAPGRFGPVPSRSPASWRGPVPETVLYLHLDRANGSWSLDGTGAMTQAEAEDLVGHSTV